MNPSNMWAPRLSSSRWGPRLSSCNSFAKNSNCDGDEASQKKLTNHNLNNATTDQVQPNKRLRKHASALNGGNKVNSKVNAKPLNQATPAQKDASDHVIRKNVSISERPHKITQVTIDILSSSDSEPEDSGSTLSFDGKLKTSNNNDTVKLPDHDVEQIHYCSMSISSDESTSDKSCTQKDEPIGSANNQIYLTSDDETSSVGSPSQRRIYNSPSTSIKTTSRAIDSPSSISKSWKTQTPKDTSTHLSGKTFSANDVKDLSPSASVIHQSRIIQPTIEVEGSSSLPIVVHKNTNTPLTKEFSSLSTTSNNERSTQSNDIENSSTPPVSPSSKNKAPPPPHERHISPSSLCVKIGKLPSNETHSSSSSLPKRKTPHKDFKQVTSFPLHSAGVKIKPTTPPYDIKSSSSSANTAVANNRTSSSSNRTEDSSPLNRSNMQLSGTQKSSSLSRITALKNKNTESASSSSSFSAVFKNRKFVPSNGTQCTLSNTISEEKKIPSSDGIQKLSSKSFYAAKTNDLSQRHELEISPSIPRSNVPYPKSIPPSNGIQNPLLSPNTQAKDKNISPKKSLAVSLSAALKNRNALSSNEKQTSLFCPTSKNRKSSPSIERHSSLSLSSTFSTKNRSTSFLGGVHDLSSKQVQEGNQSSKKIRTKSSLSVNKSRTYELINESSQLSTDINKDKYHPKDVTEKCVGSAVDYYFKSRVETEQFQVTDSVPSGNSLPLKNKSALSNTSSLLMSNEDTHRKRTQFLIDEKVTHTNQIATSRDAKNLCLSEILDEKYYQILRDCDIFTLDELRSCDESNYSDDEQIVIKRAKSLTEGSKLKAWMSIRGRRVPKNGGKSRVSLNERLNFSGPTFQSGNHVTNQSRNEDHHEFFDALTNEFFKSEGIITWENLLNFTVQDLRRKFDYWYSHYFPNQARYSPFTVAKWQLIARAHEPGYIFEPSKKRRRIFSAMSDQSILEREMTKKHTRISDADKLTLMNDDNCKITMLYENGRPIMLLTAMNHETETLYDFRLHTGMSNIPNSGFGAFLTFEGARLLKPEAAKRSKQLMKDRYPIDVPTLRFLEAKDTDGMNVSVSLEGENLHGNGNNPYFRVTRFPLAAILQNGDNIQVTIGPESIHEDIDLLRKNNEIPSPIDGFGHFKTNTKFDYVESQQDFCSHSDGCGLIDIGRYGPFLRSDRKTNLEFHLKDFVFDHEPAAWNFGVSEKLRDLAQIIDITSDSTGETHRIAKAHLPMYVNEVGHDEKLCQNVLSREKDDRVVNYYLYIQQPIKKGETVELLTHYGDKYEETRERKGYGKANIERGIKDCSDDKTRTEQNIYNRNEIEATIISMTLEEIEQTLQFLLSKIFIPLIFRIQWFTKGYFGVTGSNRDKFVETNQLSTRQWRAWRRLSWLGTMFKKRLNLLIVQPKQQDSLRVVKTKIRKMRWKCDKELLGMLKSINGKSGGTILNEIHSEIFEENLFLVSKDNQLIHTFDESLWCATARKLVRDVGEKAIARFKLEEMPVTKQELKKLATELEELATCAASDIRAASKKIGSSKNMPFHFDSAVQSLYFNEIGDVQQQEQMLHAYHDALDLVSMEECVDVEDQGFQWNISSKFLRIKKKKVSVGNEVRNCGVYSEFLYDLFSLQSEAVQIDINWYILWQVVRVVHCFATKCVEWNIEGKSAGTSIYSLERLCKKVGVSFEAAKTMLRKAMERKTNPLVNRTKKTKNEKERLEYVKYAKKDAPKTDRKLPEGWRVESSPLSKGKNTADIYWFTKTNKKLRSGMEVDIFLKYLENPDIEEDEALRLTRAEQRRIRTERKERKKMKQKFSKNSSTL